MPWLIHFWWHSVTWNWRTHGVIQQSRPLNWFPVSCYCEYRSICLTLKSLSWRAAGFIRETCADRAFAHVICERVATCEYIYICANKKLTYHMPLALPSGQSPSLSDIKANLRNLLWSICSHEVDLVWSLSVSNKQIIHLEQKGSILCLMSHSGYLRLWPAALLMRWKYSHCFQYERPGILWALMSLIFRLRVVCVCVFSALVAVSLKFLPLGDTVGTQLCSVLLFQVCAATGRKPQRTVVWSASCVCRKTMTQPQPSIDRDIIHVHEGEYMWMFW